jgi:uncharacterized protein (TIGR00290 family)
MLRDLQQQGIDTAIYGDIFLEDLRAYCKQQLARIPLQGVFPLWQRNSLDLLHEFWDLGFQAIVVCINDRALDANFCGRLLDREFVRDLPPGVDPCGENGEYHSVVFDAPYFSRPIEVVRGDKVHRTYQSPTGNASSGAADDPFAAGFWYCDLLLG